MKVLCFGSLNIDYTYKVPHFVSRGETLSSTSSGTFCGGKGLNQSIALAKAGLNVWHAGAIGADGLMLVDALNKAGVDTSLIKVLPDIRTGHAVIQNTPDGDNCILLFGGANQCITKDYIDFVISKFEAGDIIVLQNEISNLKYIVDCASARGLQVVLNPSPMSDSILALPLEKVDYFIVNEIEAAGLLGSPNISALGLHEKFPNAEIILTLGGSGSRYAGKFGEAAENAVSVEPVDTTAAGDTFTGFFLSGISNGYAPSKAMAIASAAAAISVTREGASPSIPTLSEVKSFMKERDL